MTTRYFDNFLTCNEAYVQSLKKNEPIILAELVDSSFHKACELYKEELFQAVCKAMKEMINSPGKPVQVDTNWIEKDYKVNNT